MSTGHGINSFTCILANPISLQLPCCIMKTIYDLKPAFQSLLRPLCRRLAARGVTANQVTLSAIALSILAGALIAIFPGYDLPYLFLPLALFIRMALNAIDGMLAREHDMRSDLGMVLNEAGDVISDAAIYLPFMMAPYAWDLLVGTFVVLALTSELVGILGLQLGGERRYDGPLGKSDRAFAIGAVSLALGLGVRLGVWINAVFLVLVVLIILTIRNRVRAALNSRGTPS